MVIVMLWESHRGSGPANAGHASLAITRPRPNAPGNECVSMITWFPSSGASSTSSGLVTKTPSHAVPRDLMEEMSRFMGRGQERTAYIPGVQPKTTAEQELLKTRLKPPSRICRLSSLSDPDSVVGLSDVNMLSWWEEYQKRPDYNFATRNCSTAVAGGLLAGGGAAFASPPGLISWTPYLWSPHKVYDWAVEIQKVLEPRNDALRQARTVIEADAPKVDEDVWNLATWKTKSSISMAHRYQALKDIDASLEDYHKFRQEIAAKIGNAPSDLELPKLGQLVAQICRQMVERPDSARREAVIRLGGQVIHRTNMVKARIDLEMEQKARERAALIAPLQKQLDQIAEESARVKGEKEKTERRMLGLYNQKALHQKVFGAENVPNPTDLAHKRLVHRQLLQRAYGIEERKAQEINDLIAKIP